MICVNQNIDCSSDHVGVSLSFWRWLGIESASRDGARSQVSNNGLNRFEDWRHNTGSANDGQWVEQTFDLSAVADNLAHRVHSLDDGANQRHEHTSRLEH